MNEKTMNATGNNNQNAKILIKAIPLAIFMSVFIIVGIFRGYMLGTMTNSDFILFVSVTSSAFFCFILILLFVYFNETSEHPWRILK
ncbi:hypothetical protein C5S31_05850 [ANME-1 cluster archaeon GoMg2]|nr:hypothetical protein [ANME-1 cluster archaeon GoMg2]